MQDKIKISQILRRNKMPTKQVPNIAKNIPSNKHRDDTTASLATRIM